MGAEYPYPPPPSLKMGNSNFSIGLNRQRVLNVSLASGDGQQIEAQKMILAASSPFCGLINIHNSTRSKENIDFVVGPPKLLFQYKPKKFASRSAPNVMK